MDGRHQSQSNPQFHIKHNRRKKNIMQLAMIGLGRMGGNMAKRITQPGTRWSDTTAPPNQIAP